MKKIKLGNISIANYPYDTTIINPDKKPIPVGEYTLVINYPLSTNVLEKLVVGANTTTRNIISFICKAYRKIYDEEDSSTTIEAACIPDMYNRNHTDGKYGIWGHVIEDLHLMALNIKEKTITLSVDS